MLLDISKIIESYGAYYEQAGQNASRLEGVPFVKGEFLSIPGIQSIQTSDTIYRMANTEFGEILQPFQHNFTAKGAVDFFPNTIVLQHMKVDAKMAPEEIEESWLGFLGGDSSKNQENWPVARWIMEEYIANQIAQDKELNVIYKGKHVDATTNVAGAASQCMDGIKECIVKGAASDYSINVIDGIGALNMEEVFDQVNEFDRQIDPRFAQQNIIICVAPEFVRAYKEAKRDKGYYFIQSDSQISERIDFTNHTLYGLQCMAGTTDMWATWTKNVKHLKKRNDGMSHIDVQKSDREIKMLLDWYEAIGFGVNKLVWATRETAQRTVEKPVIAFNTETKAMSITCATAGATIKYTTDGTTPTNSSSTYSSAVTLDETKVVKAIAFKSGMNTSAVDTKTCEVSA